MRGDYSWKIVASLILLNLIVIVSSNSKCATLYNARSYQGTPFSVQDGSKHPSLRYMSFVPNSIRVTPGCALTIFDSYGNKQAIDRDQDNLGYSAYRVLDASCCDCGGCSAAASKLGSLCARLYENSRCDSCSGFRLDMKDGDGAKKFGPLSNRMTSVAIRPGCTLTVFSSENYDGWRFNFTESNNMMGNNWYQQVSSAICGCDDAGPSSTPYFTTRPPITLPTVQTRPPMTLPTVRPTYTYYPTYPTTRWPMTLPTVQTRPPMTLPTVPYTTRAPITLPTVPTTRPPMTLPTVPTTRAPITLPTVPTTTRAPMTLPTVPTTTRAPITLPTVPTTRAPITLPTVPTTTSEEVTEDYNWFGEGESEELAATPPTTTPSSSEWSVEINSADLTVESPEIDEDDDDWLESEEEEETTTAKVSITTTTTTTTTPKPTTTRTTTTTTEASFFESEEDVEEDVDDDDEDGDDEDADDWW
ncbi:hypothetical protein Ocin01_10160 [Orchesella cincta]|uniref:Uncharacterized protein n=1 Tax=Orchesella cincta TaxID=48709 RepID=A0A1D2MTU0_ORCCI|nr:hypothetical protein Ocin01_10160 [Orchesella cincta]